MKIYFRFFLSHVKLTKTQEKHSFIEFYYQFYCGKRGTCKLRNGKKRKETKRNGKKKNEKKTRRKVTKRNEKKTKRKKTKTK